MKKYQELSNQAIVETFNNILEGKYLPIEINFQFTAVTKGKKLIVMKRIPENLEVVLNKHIQVIVNEDIFDKMDESSIEILFEQEIEKISYNMNTGKISLTDPKLKVFPGIVTKYGIEDIARAYDIEEAASVVEKE